MIYDIDDLLFGSFNEIANSDRELNNVVPDAQLFSIDPLAAYERKIRPDREGIIQFQMDNLYSYSIYIYPDTIHEFEDYEQFYTKVLFYLKDEELVNRILTFVSNFKLVNFNVKTKEYFQVFGYNNIA